MTQNVTTWLTTAAIIMAVVVARLPAFGQHDHKLSGYEDSEQVDITTKKQRLERDDTKNPLDSGITDHTMNQGFGRAI